MDSKVFSVFDEISEVWELSLDDIKHIIIFLNTEEDMEVLIRKLYRLENSIRYNNKKFTYHIYYYRIDSIGKFDLFDYIQIYKKA